MERLLDIPNSVGVKWATPDIEKFYAGISRFLPRVAVVDNMLLPIESHMRGCGASVSHVSNYCPEFFWQVWGLMEEGKYQKAQALHDAFMLPYSELVGQIAAATAGEGVFVRPFMATVGLNGGYSRLPSRDKVVTPEIQEEIRKLIAQIGVPTGNNEQSRETKGV